MWLFAQGVYMFFIVASIVELLILIVGYVLITTRGANTYIIYMMGVIAGSWMTEIIEDLKKWRKMKKMSNIIGTFVILLDEFNGRIITVFTNQLKHVKLND